MSLCWPSWHWPLPRHTSVRKTPFTTTTRRVCGHTHQKNTQQLTTGVELPRWAAVCGHHRRLLAALLAGLAFKLRPLGAVKHVIGIIRGGHGGAVLTWCRQMRAASVRACTPHAWPSHVAAPLQQTRCTYIFRVWDADGDGFLNFQEFMTVVAFIRTSLGQPVDPVSLQTASASSVLLARGLSGTRAQQPAARLAAQLPLACILGVVQAAQGFNPQGRDISEAEFIQVAINEAQTGFVGTEHLLRVKMALDELPPNRTQSAPGMMMQQQQQPAMGFGGALPEISEGMGAGGMEAGGMGAAMAHLSRSSAPVMFGGGDMVKPEERPDFRREHSLPVGVGMGMSPQQVRQDHGYAHHAGTPVSGGRQGGGRTLEEACVCVCACVRAGGWVGGWGGGRSCGACHAGLPHAHVRLPQKRRERLGWGRQT